VKRWVSLVLLLASVARRGLAEDSSAPDAPWRAADKVMAAVAAHSEAALKALAAKDDPDPWLVADELCARGGFDAADAFARAATRAKTAKLPAYVASQRARPTAPALRAALVAAFERRDEYEEEALLGLVEGAAADGADVVAIRLEYLRGFALRNLGRYGASAGSLRRAASLARSMGWLTRAADAFNESGVSAYDEPNFAFALEVWELARAVAEECGDRAFAATNLRNRGLAYGKLGEIANALESHRAALTIHESLGNRAQAARSLIDIGEDCVALREYRLAEESYGRSMRIREELGDVEGMAVALRAFGRLHEAQLDWSRARGFHERSLEIRQVMGDDEGTVRSLDDLSFVCRSLGEFKRARECSARSLELSQEMEDLAGASAALTDLGLIAEAEGDLPRAREHHESALKLDEETGAERSQAISLRHLGRVLKSMGDYPGARARFERALGLEEKAGDRAAVASLLWHLGTLSRALDDYLTARRHFERALKIYEGLGDRRSCASLFFSLGAVADSLSEVPAAREFYARALALAEELEDRQRCYLTLWSLGLLHNEQGDPRKALDAAHRAVRYLESEPDGYVPENLARERSRSGSVFDMGASAAGRLMNAAEATRFLEGGRSRLLISALRAGEALREVALPAGLREEDVAARSAERTAITALRSAISAGDEAAVAAARGQVETAQRQVRDVMARIRLDPRAAAVGCPEPDTLEAIRARLRPGEVLLTFSRSVDHPFALVVTTGEARIVPLEDFDDLEAACLGFGGAAGDAEREAALAALRTRIIEPLALDKRTTRLLVSPHGALTYVPFVLLVPGREVCYLPSATTYGILRKDVAKRGEGVLALGGSRYGRRIEAGEALPPGAIGVGPLPSGPASEAKAVGDVVIPEDEATVPKFRELLTKRPRWRAVHVLCHARFDPERPMLSRLAVTPDRDADGWLSPLDIFRMQVPCDLVVLSASTVIEAEVHLAEGIVGLTRAFMFAGAPRVIVSLWSVEDAAAQALMVKFYELWGPKDGAKGLPAATALKRAQEFVAAQRRWKHPKYWAAWQLWGLPD